MSLPIPEAAQKRQLFQWCNEGDLHGIQVESDPESGKDVVFLNDIQEVFPDRFLIKTGIDVVPYLKDGRRKPLEPRRIEYQPNVVLKVVPAIDSTPPQNSSSSGSAIVVMPQLSSRHIEESAAQPASRVSATGQLLTEIAHVVGEVRDIQQKHHAETVDMMKTTHNWLALILDRANAIFRLTYELHEYPIPRLFVILPSRKSFKNKINPLVDKYRLYFLCECDVSSGDGNRARPHIHFAKHDGYDLERPTEFFRKYGSYILALLYLLKVSVVAASFSVPHIAGIGQGLAKGIENVEDAARKQLTKKVDQAIGFLKDIPSIETVSTGNDRDEDYNDEVEKIEALEGADLRHLSSFLKSRDTTRVLGNLYRLARPDGTIKWVCLDHYRDEYKMIDQKHFSEFVTANNGAYHANEGKVEIWLSSRQMASQFYQQLSKARFVHELEVTLDWYTTLDDFKELKMVMDSLPTILSLTVDCCNTQTRIRDIVARGTPSTVLAKVMAGHGLQAFSIVNCSEFLYQFEKVSTTNQLRRIDIGIGIDGQSQVNLISSLVKKSPCLRHLVVWLTDLPSARGIFMSARPYPFTGVSILEAQVETKEILIGTFQGTAFSSVSLYAMECKRNFLDLSFVTKMTTKIESDGGLDYLRPFFRSRSKLREVDVEVETGMFLAVHELLVNSDGIRSAYLHDSDMGNNLRFSNIRDLRTAEIDLHDDSVDFERLFERFNAVPRFCGSNIKITNDMFAKLEERTRIKSKLQGLRIDISLLDDKGVENAIIIIKRSDLQELSIMNLTYTLRQATAADEANSSIRSNWKLLEAVLPNLRGTHLKIDIPINQIHSLYTLIRELFSNDSKCELTMGEGDNYILLKDIQDNRSAKVVLSTDFIGVSLEEFYTTFGSLPGILGDNIKISDAKATFLARMVRPADKGLKRLIVDPSILSNEGQQEILGVIDRHLLVELIIHYQDGIQEFLVNASTTKTLKNEMELTLTCEVAQFIWVYGLMCDILGTLPKLRLSLRNGTHKVVFEDIQSPLFKITYGMTGEFSSRLPLHIYDVFVSNPGFSNTITATMALTLESWSRFFPSQCTSIQVDTVNLKEHGVQAMVSVISRSMALTLLSIHCSSSLRSEKTIRTQFLIEILPFLNNVELHVHCHADEFTELHSVIEIHMERTLHKKPHFLCDGDRQLAFRLEPEPELILILQGQSSDSDAGKSVLEGELGETLIKLGSYLIHLDITPVNSFNKYVAQLSTAISVQSRLKSLSLVATHFDVDGCDSVQEIIDRSVGTLEILSICVAFESGHTMASMRAIQLLVQNQTILTKLDLQALNIRFWIQELARHLPTRSSLPRLTSFQVHSDGKVFLDEEIESWIVPMVQLREGCRSLRAVGLHLAIVSEAGWMMFFKSLDMTSLETLALTGSNITRLSISNWTQRFGIMKKIFLKQLNLEGTFMFEKDMPSLQREFESRHMEVEIKYRK